VAKKNRNFRVIRGKKKSATSPYREAAPQIIRGKRKNTLPQSIFYFVLQLTF
jgi:hypothetical protein